MLSSDHQLDFGRAEVLSLPSGSEHGCTFSGTCLVGHCSAVLFATPLIAFQRPGEGLGRHCIAYGYQLATRLHAVPGVFGGVLAFRTD